MQAKSSCGGAVILKEGLGERLVWPLTPSYRGLFSFVEVVDPREFPHASILFSKKESLIPQDESRGKS